LEVQEDGEIIPSERFLRYIDEAFNYVLPLAETISGSSKWKKIAIQLKIQMLKVLKILINYYSLNRESYYTNLIESTLYNEF